MMRRLCVVLSLILAAAVPAGAQSRETKPAFTVATSHIFRTGEKQTFDLIFRQLDHLDFRVYRVNDAFTFFEKMRDPHQLGSTEPVVPQERTYLERIADWKASRRYDVRNFVRQQFSVKYRRERAQQDAQARAAKRRTTQVTNFAQVPLLNASQLVTSWREHLPPTREAEYRKVPLELTTPGVYVVEAVLPPLKAYTVVIVSDIGLVTKTAPGEMLVFAAHRMRGDPAGNCRVRVLVEGKPLASGTTASDGTFKTPLSIEDEDTVVTLADCNGQIAATDPGAYTIREQARELIGYTYTDRPIYRPGHTVNFKSILRWREKGALSRAGLDAAEVTIRDGNDKVLLREQKKLDEFGTLSGSFVLPASAMLGNYAITIARGEDTANGSFEVQEYRKPEYDVSVRTATPFELQGKSIKATITARYYFGQPVAGASVKYSLYRQGYYSPLRYQDGGEGGEGGGEEEEYEGYAGGAQEIQGTATLNDQGVAEVDVPLEVSEQQRDYTARIEAHVIDASGRDVSGAGASVATYGRFMVIADAEEYVYRPGRSGKVRLRAVDYQGAAQPNVPLRLQIERWDWRRRNEPPDVVTSGAVTADAAGRAVWTFTAPREPGTYRIRATAMSEGRQVGDLAHIWVAGYQEVAEDEDFGYDKYLELIADRRTYTPGDTAMLVIRGAEFESSVLVTKENQHVSEHRVVKAKSNEAIELPVTADDIGDTYVSIAFLKDDRLYRAERRLNVPAVQHQLSITATADRDVVKPGQPGTYTLKVVDAKGMPVRAQLSVGIVDEALYAVRKDTTPDPLRFFYRREYNHVNTSFSRDYSFSGHSGTQELLLAHRRRPMTLADFKAERPDRPRVRKEFPDTALWLGAVTTRPDGSAQIKVDYPDSLTTWRLTVRAVTTATDVGTAKARVLTTKDLILRVVTPRFLTEGDRVTVPAIVHNYLPDDKTVSVSLAADGLTPSDAASGGSIRDVTVAHNGEQRADWSYVAAQVRPVTITGKATTDAAGDAMAITLPVNPAGLERNTSSAGSIVDAGERMMDVMIPATANASGRSVRVTLAPSLAGTMLGALDYLTSYPWGCTEQTLSSFVPNIVVLRALSDLKLAPTERLKSLDRQVSQGLQRLYGFQHEDGGWGWWKTDENDPFMTAYAIDSLVQARDNGVRVDGWRIENAKRALHKMYADYPRAIPDLKAYMVYALLKAARPGETGFDFAAALDELWSSHSRMTTSGQALLLLILDERKDARGNELASTLLAGVKTRGDLAWWSVESDPFFGDYYDTSTEGTALALKALAARDPGNVLLERVARYLMVSRTGSYWFSTKQTALALQGLLAYMRARGEQPAPFTADVFVDGQRAATHRFDAAALLAPDPIVVDVPVTSGMHTVRIVKQNAGALYYTAGVRYFDPPAAADYNGSRKLAVARSYALLTPVTKDGRIVYREASFSGDAKVGDVILVRLVTAGANDWKYVMLEDPIPAGTEHIEQEGQYELENRPSWFWGSQREFRDDRTAFFLSAFTKGSYEFTYLLRVTTPGTFRAMPARVQPMYAPDVFASAPVIAMTVSPEGVR